MALTGLYTKSFAHFVRASWPYVEGSRVLKWNWHMDAVCSHLQALADGTLGNRKVIFNVPPRTSKSTLVTIAFPCWLWTREPWLQFMFASYSFSLSRDHAYKRRAIIESPWYKRHWGDKIQLSGDRNNIVEIANKARGLMYTTSVGGATVGRGGDYLLLDDPNSADEMESEAQRESNLRFVDASWSTRANDAKTVREVVIQQRTHEEDVTGHLLKQQPGEWLHVKIPMEYRRDSQCVTPIWKDPRTHDGQLIDPERFPPEYIAGQKVRLGSYRYAGQYDQSPAPPEGGMIQRKWFKYYTAEPDGWLNLGGIRLFHQDLPRFVTVDLATSVKTSADYTVIAAWAVYFSPAPWLLLLDLHRSRMEGPEILPQVRNMMNRWKASPAWIERAGFQLSLIQEARRRGFPVRELEADRDKIARALQATPLMEAGGFWLPQEAPYLADLEAEMLHFPNGKHDDQLDCVAYAARIAYSMKSEGLTIASADRNNSKLQEFGDMIPTERNDRDELERGFFR